MYQLIFWVFHVGKFMYNLFIKFNLFKLDIAPRTSGFSLLSSLCKMCLIEKRYPNKLQKQNSILA